MTAFQLFSYWESLPSAPASGTLHASYRERRRICNETHSLYTTHEVGSVSSMRIYDQLTVVTDERVQLDYLLLEPNKVTQCEDEGDIGCLQTTLTHASSQCRCWALALFLVEFRRRHLFHLLELRAFSEYHCLEALALLERASVYCFHAPRDEISSIPLFRNFLLQCSPSHLGG